MRRNDAAYGFAVRYPNDLWDVRVEWRHIEGGFAPALGFVSRSNVRKFDLTAEYDPRPKRFLNVRQMFHEFRVRRFTRLDNGRVESWRVFVAPINWTLDTGDRFELNYIPTFERLFEPDSIVGVALPRGDYRFTRYRAEFATASKRPWKLEGLWWFGGYWSGRADQIEASFGYKWAPHLETGFTLDETFGRLPQGRFVARVLALRADCSVSPFLTFYNLVQYDDESRDLGWQSRMRWRLRPGSEAFLVFGHDWLRDESGEARFHPTQTRLGVKMQYMFRF